MQEAWPERGTGGKSTEAMLKASSSTFFDCDEALVKDLAKYYALGHERGLVRTRPLRQEKGMGPHTLLSTLSILLSPITKKCLGGISTGP